MSIVNDNSFSPIVTQSGNDGIMFKNYHFGLKRTNKNGNKVWICTHKSCNASITTNECSILKTSSMKSDGRHDYEHSEKMSLHVYECMKSIKRRIEEEPTAPVSFGPRGPPIGGSGSGPQGPPSGGKSNAPGGPPIGGSGSGPRGPPSGGNGSGPRGPPIGGSGSGPQGPPSGGNGSGPRGPPIGGSGSGPQGPPSGGKSNAPGGPPIGGSGSGPRGPPKGSRKKRSYFSH
ncbi:unnamed protein product [Rotaria sp. Silwood2]|nr:unnamed protein product [Rotaria sp. Silwood2]